MQNGNENNGMNGNGKVFLLILQLLGLAMVLFGVIAIVLIATGSPSDSVLTRIVGAFGAMFAGLVGLAVGYLTGRR